MSAPKIFGLIASSSARDLSQYSGKNKILDKYPEKDCLVYEDHKEQ